jgi:predicted RNA-binding Zn-ribbon protein involved in translation (DUF1610 family)
MSPNYKKTENEIQKRIKRNVRKKRRAKRKAKKRHNYRRTYKLKRIHFGWWKRKFNIMLDPLKPFERRILLDNPLLKYSADNDQFVLILFKIYDMQRNSKMLGKQYINPYVNNITTFKEIKKNSKEINWKCAICNIKIKSNIDRFDAENFLCPKCAETHTKGQFIDDRILYSSIKFRKACEFLYKHQQETYKHFVRKSELDNR